MRPGRRVQEWGGHKHWRHLEWRKIKPGLWELQRGVVWAGSSFRGLAHLISCPVLGAGSGRSCCRRFVAERGAHSHLTQPPPASCSLACVASNASPGREP